MQWIDWAIIIVISLSAGISLIRGFVREALSLAGWILAFFVAKGFYQEFSALLMDHIATPSLRYGVAWAALFIATLTICGLLNYLIGQVVEKAGLSGMDRIMGMVFGALRGVLIVALVTLTLKTFTPVANDPWWKQSQLIPHAEILGNWFYHNLKDSMPKVNSQLSLSNGS